MTLKRRLFLIALLLTNVMELGANSNEGFYKRSKNLILSSLNQSTFNQNSYKKVRGISSENDVCWLTFDDSSQKASLFSIDKTNRPNMVEIEFESTLITRNNIITSSEISIDHFYHFQNGDEEKTSGSAQLDAKLNHENFIEITLKSEMSIQSKVIFADTLQCRFSKIPVI